MDTTCQSVRMLIGGGLVEGAYFFGVIHPDLFLLLWGWCVKGE
jgi:hypothetical protein